jgi:hypothetical protein
LGSGSAAVATSKKYYNNRAVLIRKRDSRVPYSIVGEYIKSEAAGLAIAKIARSEFKRRRSAFEAVSLFDAEDVSQEIWFRLIEREPDVSQDDLPNRVRHHSDLIAHVGRMRRRSMPVDCVSNLSKPERQEYNNRVYAIRTGE